MTTDNLGEQTEEEPTIGRLVADTTAGFSSLLHSEIELAKTELRVSVKAGGIGAALFAVAGFLLVLGIIMLSFAFAHFLEWLYFGPAISFVIVFGVYALIAVVMALVGLKLVKKVKAPEQAIAEAKSTKQVLKR
ncbi:MAG: phage holin family protein [Nocardioidaceae bacterium]